MMSAALCLQPLLQCEVAVDGEWKDADPDLPILKQAKSEYARLQ
jgi:hypothetical protein